MRLLIATSGVQPTEQNIPQFQREALVSLVDENLQLQELKRVFKTTARGFPGKVVLELDHIDLLPGEKLRCAAQNMQIMTGGADEMRSFWREQIELWKRIAATAKIELQ